MSEENIDMFAIRAALGNNGGSWANHYTAEQREHWRNFVRDLITALSNTQNNTRTIKMW